MPKRVSDADLTALLEAVAGFPEPASIEEIGGRSSISLPRRTLQRRLALLVEQGKLDALGARRGRRYRIGLAHSPVPEAPAETPTEPAAPATN